MTEPPMSLFCLAAVAAIACRSGAVRPWRYAAAGALCFCAGLVKQPGFLMGVPIGLSLLWWSWQTRSWGDGLRRLGLLTAGALVAFALWSAWLLSQGTWSSWAELMTGYHGVSNTILHEMFDVPPPSEPAKWIDFTKEYFVRRTFMVFGVLGFALAARGGHMLVTLRASAFVLAALTMFLPISYGLGLSHYLLMAEPWWILLSVGFLSWLVKLALSFRPGPKWRWAALVAVPLFLGAAFWQIQDLRYLQNEAVKRGSLTEQIQLGQELKGDVLVLANPIYYFFAHAEPPLHPKRYFLVFRIPPLKRSKPAELNRQVLDHVNAADVVVVDRKRWKIIRPILKQSKLFSQYKVVSKFRRQGILLIKKRQPRPKKKTRRG